METTHSFMLTVETIKLHLMPNLAAWLWNFIVPFWKPAAHTLHQIYIYIVTELYRTSVVKIENLAKPTELME